MSIKAKNVVLVADLDYRLDWMAFDLENKPAMDLPDCLFDDDGDEVIDSIVAVSMVYDIIREKHNSFAMAEKVVEVAQNLKKKFSNVSPKPSEVDSVIMPFLDKLLTHEVIPFTMANEPQPDDDAAVAHIKLIVHHQASIDFATFDAEHNPSTTTNYNADGNYMEKSFTDCHQKPRQVFGDDKYDLPALKDLLGLLVKIQEEGGLFILDKAVREALQVHQRQCECRDPSDSIIKMLETRVVTYFIDQTLKFQTPAGGSKGGTSDEGDHDTRVKVFRDQEGKTKVKVEKGRPGEEEEEEVEVELPDKPAERWEMVIVETEGRPIMLEF